MAYAQPTILTDLIREAAHPLTGDKEDYNPLLAMIADARLVLLGEASHGTHEFYREWAQITKRLITEKGFRNVTSTEVIIMPTREIPRSEWVVFFDSFSNQHHGWLVTVEIMNSEIGDQTMARNLPLEGITAELNDEGPDEIEIVVGNKPDSHVSDTVVAPKNIWLKSSEEGADEALEILGENKTVLIQFRSVIRPEFVDSILTR